MRTGQLFRSNALNAESVDQQRLDAAGLSAVFDLRTTAEVTPKPDVALAGARYVRHNVIGDDLALKAFDPESLTDAAAARGLLTEVYRLFVTQEHTRREFGSLIRALAADDGAAVFHCSAEKDRTGWAAAVVQRLLGVSTDDVFADYLLTNQRLAAISDQIAERVERERGAEVAQAARVLSGVFPEALQSAFTEADEVFGGFDQYVREGLDVNDRTVDLLRTKLLV